MPHWDGMRPARTTPTGTLISPHTRPSVSDGSSLPSMSVADGSPANSGTLASCALSPNTTSSSPRSSTHNFPTSPNVNRGRSHSRWRISAWAGDSCLVGWSNSGA